MQQHSNLSIAFAVIFILVVYTIIFLLIYKIFKSRKKQKDKSDKKEVVVSEDKNEETKNIEEKVEDKKETENIEQTSSIGFVANKKEAHEALEKQKYELRLFIQAVKEVKREAAIQLSEDQMESSYTGDKKESVYLYDFIKEWSNNGISVRGGDILLSDGSDSDNPLGEFMNDLQSSGNVAVGSFPNRGIGTVVSSNTTPDTNPSDSVEGDVGVSVIAVSSNVIKPSDKNPQPFKIFKPIEVFDELQRVPKDFIYDDIDEKIMVLKMKEKFIRYNQYAKKEVIDMVTRLENRKKYKEFEEFFGVFDTTTTDKINDLVSKYKLAFERADLFIPKFPKDAIEIMNEYDAKTMELCGKRPVFYVIAEAKDFRKEFKRNDPILLVQSPFGIFWNILGAWDKEMIMLEDL